MHSPNLLFCLFPIVLQRSGLYGRHHERGILHKSRIWRQRSGFPLGLPQGLPDFEADAAVHTVPGKISFEPVRQNLRTPGPRCAAAGAAARGIVHASAGIIARSG